jgi:hypothetical protein
MAAAVLERIGPAFGGADFAAMSLDSKVVGGITLEEYEIWLFGMPFTSLAGSVLEH